VDNTKVHQGKECEDVGEDVFSGGDLDGIKRRDPEGETSRE
jgi:hypothetical protein